MLAKAMEVARPRAARIDEGRDPAGPCQQLGLDAERGAAPIDVRMQVDEAGRDDLAHDVAGIRGRKIAADCRDLAAGKGNIRYLVEPL